MRKTVEALKWLRVQRIIQEKRKRLFRVKCVETVLAGLAMEDLPWKRWYR